MFKPDNIQEYDDEQTLACERLLVTLLRFLGPWGKTVTLIGGLVPTLLYEEGGHVGTQDVDLVLDLEKIKSTEAYSSIDKNLKRLGLERGQNEDKQVQNWRWVRRDEGEPPLTLEFLCPSPDQQGLKIVPLKSDGQKRLSALGLPGAHLVLTDFEERVITADMLDGHGSATVTVRMAGVVAYVVLKALAYEDRVEHKDAYDLIYILMRHPAGPGGVGALFAAKMADNPDEPLYDRALNILVQRFLSDELTDGAAKDGPTSYARFTAPNDPEEQQGARQNAVATIALFLEHARSK